MFTARTLFEGKWVLLILAGLVVAGWSWHKPTALVPLVLLLFTLSFFRDPDRVVPADPKVIVAPADGRIVEVKPAGQGTMVAIFLSVFDVHVQRAPLAGTIRRVRYHPGKFLDARRAEATSQNENREVEIEAADGFRVTVRQIAGLIARRIVGWAGEGAPVQQGERIGMIRFGSRVELILPAEVEVVAQVGEYAKGGETVVARRK